jgi:hypothetical protein
MFIVAYYTETGDFPPMYWRGGWDQDRGNAHPYTREDAEMVAENLEGSHWYTDMCVRVIQA